MQHWNVYKKWNERLYQEMYSAYDNGRAEKDPTDGWYKGELWFFDNYIIPLAQKLEECGAFGVSSSECLNYALENRKEWALKGKQVVQEMKDRYQKRKMLEVDGFTDDEIENFSSEDLGYILSRLVKKGRTLATFRGQEKEGLLHAAKAWFHAFELYERSPSSMNLSDATLIFAIFSGLMVFLKGELIIQDDDHEFEQNLAERFCQEAKMLRDPIHYSRALAVKCDVQGRRGNFQEAIDTFEVLKNTYLIEEHSQRLSKHYGTDRAAQMYSQVANWHYGLGNYEQARICSEYVVQKILPWMETKNVLNTVELLLPAIRILKSEGQAKWMSDLFEQHIMKEFQSLGKRATLCQPILLPLSMLLKVAGDTKHTSNITDIVTWLLTDKNGEFEDFLDYLYSKLGWAPSTMTAELCLLCATRLIEKSNNKNNHHHDDKNNDNCQDDNVNTNTNGTSRHTNRHPLLVRAEKLILKGLYISRKLDLKLNRITTNKNNNNDNNKLINNSNNNKSDRSVMTTTSTSSKNGAGTGGTWVAYELHESIMAQLENLASSSFLMLEEEEIRQKPLPSVHEYGPTLKTKLGEIRLMTE